MANEEKMVMSMMVVVMMAGIVQTLLQPSRPQPPAGRAVSIGLKNPPLGATQWQFALCDWDVTQMLGWGGSEVRDNLQEVAEFVIPDDWEFPLRIVNLSVFRFDGEVLYQVYYIQSFRPYLWDWDKGDWGDQPDPTYKEVFITWVGSYMFNVSTEAFEGA